MSADDTFREAAARGLLLNNLYQMADSRWRANWRDTAQGYPFGDADTPQAALQRALAAVPVAPSGIFD
jgi:hypothetical protein